MVSNLFTIKLLVMKKIMLLNLLVFVVAFNSFSQTNLLQNGDMNIPVGCPTGNNEKKPCPNFTIHTSNSTVCTPTNWTRSHGTPSWSKNPNNPFDGTLHTWAQYVSSSKTLRGEGVFAKHNFTPLTTVYIEVQLVYPLFNDIALKLRLLDDKQFTVEPPLPVGCGETIPLKTQAEAPELSTLLPSSSGRLNYLIKYAVPPVQQGRKWDKLWVYPYNYTSSLRLGVVIDYIHIYEENPCGKDVVHTTTSRSLPSGIYHEYSFTAGSNNSTVTYVDPHAITEWWYLEKSELVHTFEASPQEDNYFLIAPDNNDCEFYRYVLTKTGKERKVNSSTNNFYHNISQLVKIDDAIEEKNNNQLQNGNKQINVYPNPNNGNFTLRGTVNYNGIAQIEIINILGQIVYKKNTNINNSILNQEIQLNDVVNGVYLLKLSGNGYNEHIKFKID